MPRSVKCSEPGVTPEVRNEMTHGDDQLDRSHQDSAIDTAILAAQHEAIQREKSAAIFSKNPGLWEAWQKLKPFCAEVYCVEGNAFSGGDEECFTKGTKDGMTCFVFSPDLRPYVEGA